MGWGLFAEPAGILLLAAASVAGLGWFLSACASRRTCEAHATELDGLNDQIETLEAQITNHMVNEAALNGRVQAVESRANELREELQQGKAASEVSASDLSSARATIRELETRIEEERKAAAEKLAILDEARQKLSNEFKVLANQIFEEKGKAFSEQNKQGLDDILKPVQSELKSFRDRIETVHKEDVEARGAFKQQLNDLQSLNKQMNDEARNLTRALKGDKKIQGDWGELVLETVLEQSGLRKDKEYSTQGGFRDAEGKLRKPDVILNLPDGKHMVIDSKVSLVAYNEYMRADDDEDRESALRAHLQSVQSHIDELSNKDYSSLIGLKSPDFVFMFMPIEAAFMAAFQRDEKLFAKAFERNIVVVTPTTLLATLRTVENIWRYERQNENAKRIADKAGAVYDKLRGFLEDFEKLGSQLQTAQKSYDVALNKLTHGQGNLVRQAEGFVELGVKVKKQLPKSILAEASIETTALEDDSVEGKGI